MTWNDINAAGIVFLPAAGYRDNASIDSFEYGYYWSSSPSEEMVGMVCDLAFDGRDVGTAHISDRGNCGYSMRLVADVE